MTFSRLVVFMLKRVPSRLGIALKNQMWTTGAASSIWPIRLRRTRLWVILTPQRSQINALVFHPAILSAGALPVFFGAENAFAEQAVLLGAVGAVVDRFGVSSPRQTTSYEYRAAAQG